jgi:hypothetical protein
VAVGGNRFQSGSRKVVSYNLKEEKVLRASCCGFSGYQTLYIQYLNQIRYRREDWRQIFTKNFVDMIANCLSIHFHIFILSSSLFLNVYNYIINLCKQIIGFYFFIIHLFTCAYIVWVISPLCLPSHPVPSSHLSSRHVLFCLYH